MNVLVSRGLCMWKANLYNNSCFLVCSFILWILIPPFQPHAFSLLIITLWCCLMSCEYVVLVNIFWYFIELALRKRLFFPQTKSENILNSLFPAHFFSYLPLATTLAENTCRLPTTMMTTRTTTNDEETCYEN